MRALVAEANVVTRVTLRRILERAGFSVEELRDELAAACLLHQPEAPELALLALDTFLVDFEQVCKSMRAAKPGVFIVALVPQERRLDLSKVLDAGADDYLIKPVTIQVAEARLRIIQRTLTVLGGSASIYTGREEIAAVQDVADSGDHKPPVSEILAELDFQKALTSVFSQMDLQPVEEVNLDDSFGDPRFTSWVPLILRKEERAQWLNVRIDLDEENASRLFETVHPIESYSEQGISHLLVEIVSLAIDGLCTAALQQDDVYIDLPIAPMAIQSGEIPSPTVLASSYAKGHSIGLLLSKVVRLHLSFTMESVPIEDCLIRQLKPLDVLAHDIQSAEYQVVLLRAGTMIKQSYIEKIQAFIHSQNLSQKVQVFRPPQGTVKFLSETKADILL